MLHEAHKNHINICKEWRKAGRTKSDEQPVKLAKKESQRNLQKITREEEKNKSISQHDDLMHTHANNISQTCAKLKKIRGETNNKEQILKPFWKLTGGRMS